MNVTNVVARLSFSSDVPPRAAVSDEDFEVHLQGLPSVLVSSHFDTIPGSPGAADDGTYILYKCCFFGCFFHFLAATMVVNLALLEYTVLKLAPPSPSPPPPPPLHATPRHAPLMNL